MHQDLRVCRGFLCSDDNSYVRLNRIERVYYYQTWSGIILFFEIKESRYIHYCRINTNFGKGSCLPKIKKKLRKHIFFDIVRDLETCCSISGKSIITYTGEQLTTVEDTILRELVFLVHDETIIRSYIMNI